MQLEEGGGLLPDPLSAHHYRPPPKHRLLVPMKSPVLGKYWLQGLATLFSGKMASVRHNWVSEGTLGPITAPAGVNSTNALPNRTSLSLCPHSFLQRGLSSGVLIGPCFLTTKNSSHLLTFWKRIPAILGGLWPTGLLFLVQLRDGQIWKKWSLISLVCPWLSILAVPTWVLSQPSFLIVCGHPQWEESSWWEIGKALK